MLRGEPDLMLTGEPSRMCEWVAGLFRCTSNGEVHKTRNIFFTASTHLLLLCVSQVGFEVIGSASLQSLKPPSPAPITSAAGHSSRVYCHATVAVASTTAAPLLPERM